MSSLKSFPDEAPFSIKDDTYEFHVNSEYFDSHFYLHFCILFATLIQIHKIKWKNKSQSELPKNFPLEWKFSPQITII